MSALELGLVLLSALLHALWSVWIKGSRDALAFNVLQLGPSLAAAAALLWLAPLAAVPGPVWWLVAATAFAHGFYYYWMTRALETGELTLVYPIARSAPAFLPLLAVPLLGESISARGAAGIAVVVAGMWAVHGGGPGWSRFASPGAGFAYLTLGSTIAYSLVDKEAMARLGAEPWPGPLPAAVVYYLLLTSASSLVFVPLALRRCSLASLAETARREGGLAVGASLVSFASYGLILQALRTAPVSYVVAARQTSVLFAVVLGVLWLGERPTRLRALGALATVVGVALLAKA